MIARARTVDPGPALLLGITMFFWGTSFRATDVGTRHASAVTFSTVRALVGALALLAFARLTGARLPRDRGTLRLAAVSGLLVVSLIFEGIAEGTKLAGPGNAAVLINTAPFFTVLFARVALAQRTSRTALAGLVAGFTGVVVIVSSQLGGGASAGRVALGMTISLAAAAGFAIGVLMIQRAAARNPGLDWVGFTTTQFVVGSLALVPLAVVYGHPGRTDWSSAALLGSVAWVAFGSSAVAAVCFNLALRRIPAARATGWQFLAPVVAVVVEAGRGNTPSASVVAGMGLAIAGVAVVNFVRTAPATPRGHPATPPEGATGEAEASDAAPAREPPGARAGG